MAEVSSYCPECGCELNYDDERSSPDNRRFFKLIRVARHHWPATHEFQPRNSEHLRNWLYCEVGFCTETPIEFGEISVSPVMLNFMRIAAETALQQAKGKGFIRVHGDKLVTVIPKSSRFPRTGRPGLSQRQFNSVRDSVTALIELVTGVTAEQLLNESESAGVLAGVSHDH